VTSPALVAPAPTATPTPNIRSAEEKKVFHDGTYQFIADAGPASSFAKTTPAPMPTATRPAIVYAPAATATATATATPQPSPTPSPPAPTAVIYTITNSTVTNEVDIEDPRFYRGSFTIAPAGSVQAAAAGTTSQGKSLYYAGSSYETLSPSYNDRTPLPVSGKAMYYNPGIMQEVYSYRLQLGQVVPCGECVGYVALLRKGDLGRHVYLRWADGTVEGPFLVIDVAARHHIGLLLARGWAVDLDYQTAMRHSMAGPVPVTILDAPVIPYNN
jgi:hypothetical protein